MPGSLAPPLDGGTHVKDPPFPQPAPLGFSLNFTEGQFQGELVLPVDLLKGIADYVSKLQAM